MLRILHNPRYAGAFTFGRYRHHKLAQRGMSLTMLPREEWISFIPDAHPGYIALDQFDANRDRLTANAATHGRDRTAGPPREGPRPAAGRHRLRPLRAPDDRALPPPSRAGAAHLCVSTRRHRRAQRICASVPGADLDERIGQLLLDTLSPLAVEAALASRPNCTSGPTDADRMRAAHVERARYHADLARRRYLAVDPANRLVADSLEADWNTALRELNDAQQAYQQARDQHSGQLTDAQRARINQLVTDLPAIWNDPATPARERKRIARLLLTDVTVHRDQYTITAHVRFPGGQDTTLTTPVPKTAGEQRKTPPQSSPPSTDCSTTTSAARSPTSSTSVA